MSSPAVPSSAAPIGRPYDGIMEKKVFELGPYRTVGGRDIPHVRFGYETAGVLNARRDNAILIPHYNSGNSHFAGRYAATDPVPGYWDALVGPGKPLDTDRYFLVSVDSLCNVNAFDGVTVTTGAQSIDPATGKPFGMRFPQIQVRDLVNVQRAFLRSLGIETLHAVMGASFGSMQAFEWAAALPEEVQRIACVVPGAYVDDYAIQSLVFMRELVMQDPHWKGGDYYDGPRPTAGLSMAVRYLTLLSLAPEWGEAMFRRRWADPAKDPATDMSHGFASTAFVNATAAARLSVADANNFLYIQRANELFTVGGRSTLEEGLATIRAPTLLLPSANDRVLPIEQARKVRDLLQARGVPVTYQELVGPMGHLNGVAAIGAAAGTIRDFLAG